MASVLRQELTTSQCYCCRPSSLGPPMTHRGIQTSSLPPSTEMTDLDASLRELGMLSSVTDSRHDYVLEKLSASNGNRPRPDFGHHHSGLCVLAMNSAYIADFSFSSSSATTGMDGPPSPSETVPLLTLKRPRVRALRRRHYLYQPYDYPWRPKLVEMLRSRDEDAIAVTVDDSRLEETKASENGNKSNPASPSKSSTSLLGRNGGGLSVANGVGGNSMMGLGGIFRSKSLDDLEICNAKASGTRVDIETVSRKISNLHVS